MKLVTDGKSHFNIKLEEERKRIISKIKAMELEATNSQVYLQLKQKTPFSRCFLF